MILLVLIGFLVPQNANAQSISEKMLREAPRLNWNMGLTYDANLQESDTYQNQQGMMFRVSPRYKLTDNFTLIGATGATQRFTQENRSDMINTSIAISRNPFSLGRVADMRATLALIVATNEIQREKESMRGALRLGTNIFFKTNTNFIAEVGASATVNNHQYSISSFGGANIQYRGTPYILLGWSFSDKWQLMAYNAYDATRTYRGTNKGFFDLDQSITYIPSRKMSFTLGHNNAGSVTTLDGRGSNVAFFDTRSSTIYLNGTFNY